MAWVWVLAFSPSGCVTLAYGVQLHAVGWERHPVWALVRIQWVNPQEIPPVMPGTAAVSVEVSYVTEPRYPLSQGWPWTYYGAIDHLEWSSYLRLPSAGITGMCHRAGNSTLSWNPYLQIQILPDILGIRVSIFKFWKTKFSPQCSPHLRELHIVRDVGEKQLSF